jgi:cytoskeletal protein RodZ
MEELHRKLGELLRIERERRKLSLEDISSQLKISETKLEYIEAGDVESLASELYFNLFSKSYAESMGIDYVRTIEAIKEDLGEPIEPPSAEHHETRRKEEGGGEHKISTDMPDATAPAQRKSNTLLMGSVAVVALVIALLVSQIVLSPNLSTRATPEQFFDDRTPSMPSSSELATYQFESPSLISPDSLVLTVVAREESWATILSDGDTALFRNMVPWREYRIAARHRLLVSIFRSRVVETRLSGTVVNIRDPETNRISRVEIDQVNLSRFLNPSSPPPASQLESTAKVEGPASSKPATLQSGSLSDSAAQIKEGDSGGL